jgi:hypothetical protein
MEKLRSGQAISHMKIETFLTEGDGYAKFFREVMLRQLFLRSNPYLLKTDKTAT